MALPHHGSITITDNLFKKYNYDPTESVVHIAMNKCDEITKSIHVTNAEQSESNNKLANVFF